MASAFERTFAFDKPKLDFEMNDKVKIDGRGRATVLKRTSSTTGDLYEVMIDGTEFTVTIRAERLTRWELKVKLK